MRKYIYPQDLTARATMWLWQLNDLAAIGALCLAGAFCAAQLGTAAPLLCAAGYAFLTVRFEGQSIRDFYTARARIFSHRVNSAGMGKGKRNENSKKKTVRQGTRRMINAQAVTPYGLLTYRGGRQPFFCCARRASPYCRRTLSRRGSGRW